MQRLAANAAYACAILGGIVLIALMMLTCFSIFGRAFAAVFPNSGLGPVPGDYEVVEAAIGFSIFCFLPYCQFVAGHATVDVFTNALSYRANRLLLTIWEAVTAVVAVLVLWRLYAGMLSKFGNGETSLLLEFPIWWAYAAALIPAAVFLLVTVWSTFDRFNAFLRNKDSRAFASGDLH